ncbi:hypothetical protein ACIOC2_19280 [Streptomyces sp. NPDC088337]|uniref:hypothetical protein n=1 Tax=unclassified Streptomyces TaxID=2593676 RepID=UPI0038072884
MSDLLLPASFSRVTVFQRVVPVTGRPDLTEPITGRIVIPALLELHLRRDEGTPNGTRERAHVAVTGPRRLKSQQPGKPITSIGWHCANGDDYRRGAARPDWLTEELAGLLPDGWDPALLDLTHGGEPR